MAHLLLHDLPDDAGKDGCRTARARQSFGPGQDEDFIFPCLLAAAGLGQPGQPGDRSLAKPAPHQCAVINEFLHRKVYVCPSDSMVRTVNRGDNLGAGYWTRNPVTTHSYAVHNYNGVTGAPTHLDRYTAPAAYPFIVDESAVTIDAGNFQSTWDIMASRHRVSRESAGSYDNAGGNILFLDGHIQLFRARDVVNAEQGMFQD